LRQDSHLVGCLAEDKQQWMEQCARWVESRYGCEVYLVHHDDIVNGFAEYRNGRSIIYILGDLGKLDFALFLDILAHETGHVLYNQRQMAKGMTYEELVSRTEAKLNCFHELLEKRIITAEEYDRLYSAMEEEWESDQEKGKVLAELRKYLLH